MNNIYDILAKFNSVADKQTLTEGARPDFLDLDRDDDRKEPMKQAARQAKAVKEDDMDESALQAYLGKKKYGEEGMKALQKAGREGVGKEKMARIRAQHDKMDEAEVGEGNDFTGARLAAIRAGKPTFKVDGKTYRVTGDTRDEKQQVDEREMKDKDEFDRSAEPGDYYYTSSKGKVTKTKSGISHERRAPDEDADDERDDDKPRGRGRPKGSKRALGAKGPTGRSKLLNKKSIKETDLEEDYDRDEYDEEGEMAKSQLRTIEKAAEELQAVLGDDENLPEWAQKKITLAVEYLDSARDYLTANRPGEETMMAEKAVSKAQRAAAGIAYAAKKGDIPRSELRGASKEMARMATGELKKFAKTKEKGLPEKVKKEESVEETTTAGSVATAPAEAPKGKKGMVFGKGVYEGLNKQFNQLLTEGMSINASQDESGKKSLSVTATDDDAVKLAQILKLAGMEQAQDYHDACPSCGADKGMCEHTQMEEGEYANSPEQEVSDTDTMINTLSGGLNGRKSTGQTTIPVLNRDPARQVSLDQYTQTVKEEAEQRLWDLYKRYETK